MFFGKYFHSVDQKGRMRLPSKLRQGLGEKVYVMRGTPGCLYIFTEEQFKLVETALSSVPLYDTEKQKVVRAILSSGELIEEDNQGRFLLSQTLRNSINLDKEIVFVGAGKKVELWSKEAWDKENGVSEEDYAQSLTLLNDLGI